MSEDTVDFVAQLAFAKARSAPKHLRRSAQFAYQRRWLRMLAISAVSTFTASLLQEHDELMQQNCAHDGGEPWLPYLLSEARHDDPVGPGRLR